MQRPRETRVKRRCNTQPNRNGVHGGGVSRTEWRVTHIAKLRGRVQFDVQLVTFDGDLGVQLDMLVTLSRGKPGATLGAAIGQSCNGATNPALGHVIKCFNTLFDGGNTIFFDQRLQAFGSNVGGRRQRQHVALLALGETDVGED